MKKKAVCGHIVTNRERDRKLSRFVSLTKPLSETLEATD